MANEQIVCLDRFIKEIKDDLSVACQIPLSIPNKRIISIIERSKDWFYKHYEDAVEQKYYLILKDTWTTDSYLQTRTIPLPDTVISVFGVREVGKGHSSPLSFVGKDPDFSIDRFTYSNLYKPAIQSDAMMYYVINEKLWDQARQIFQHPISYNYSRLTHKLRIQGETPQDHVVLTIYDSIDDCSLFSDEIFFRWVVASCKVQLGRVLGTFTYNLPGNVTINADMIMQEGKDELEAIKEEIKTDEGTDWFFTM